MVLARGAVVPVRLEDPGRVLSAEARARGTHVQLAVANDALVFHASTVVSEDASGRTEQVVIPFDTAVKLVAFGSMVQFRDSAGIALAPGGAARMDLLVPSGRTPDPIRIVLAATSR
jgi:hypothetical protein